MLRMVLFIAVLVFAYISISSAAILPNQALLILRSDQFSDTEATIAELEDLGAHTHHVFPPSTLIAEIPPEIEAQVVALPNVAYIYRSEAPLPPGSEPTDDPGIGAWNHLVSASYSTSLESKAEPPMFDAKPHPIPKRMLTAQQSAAPGYYSTDDYMIGKVALGLVLPESTGSAENWNATRKQTVVNKTVEGMNWWIQQGGTAAHLSFYYDNHLGVTCAYEPIQCNDDTLWFTDVMAHLGYNQGFYLDRMYKYVNDIRSNLHTDWAFMMIVADSYNDPDGRFADGQAAYAYIGGPLTVLCWDNNGWGISNFSRVASHEVGHIFRADDEYAGSCWSAECGYLFVPNNNCETGNPNSVPCMMRINELTLCPWSPATLGWRDSDGDGIYDPVDNDIVHIIDSQELSLADNKVTITGSLANIPWDSPTCTDVTVNKITSVKYKIDNGSWSNATAIDGAFDLDTEGYTFTTASLAAGIHNISISATTNYGNSLTVTRIVDPYPPVVTHVDDGGELAYDSTSLSASWTATEEHSEITEYAYAIGTTPSDPESGYISNWTNTFANSVIVTDLNLSLGGKYYFYVKAKNSSGLWSAVTASDGVTISQINIGAANHVADDTAVELTAKVVTGQFYGCFYVEEADRTAGLKVISWGSPPVGSLATVHGKMTTEGPERAIDATGFSWLGSGTVSPMLMTNRQLGGHFNYGNSSIGFSDAPGLSSLYNLGLLVKTAGRITYVDRVNHFAYVDDGSALTDGNALGEAGTDVKGVRVDVPVDVPIPPMGSHVTLIGISSSDLFFGSAFSRLLPLRTRDDLKLTSGALIEGTVIARNRRSIDYFSESEHPYNAQYNYSWEIQAPSDAARMRLHFTQMELEEGMDVLEVRDISRHLINSYQNSVMTFDIWSDWLDGNWAMIFMDLRSGGHYGFAMDQYEIEESPVPVAGVMITLDPGGRTVVTGEDGRFRFDGLDTGTYTLTPSLGGSTFSPSELIVTVAFGDYMPDLGIQKN